MYRVFVWLQEARGKETAFDFQLAASWCAGGQTDHQAPLHLECLANSQARLGWRKSIERSGEPMSAAKATGTGSAGHLDGDDEAAREVATVFAAPTPLTDADAEELARLKVWRENVLSAKRKQTKNSS